MPILPIDKTLAQVRDDVFAKLGLAQESGWLPEFVNLNRGPIRGMLELWAWGLHQLYRFMLAALEQAFPLAAGTAWLDLHCRQVEVIRKPATQAAGRIIFTRAPGQPGSPSGSPLGVESGNIRIPKGRIVRTKPDGRGEIYRYGTLADAVLQAGLDTVEVPVLAETYGRAANATAGQICEISTHIPGIGAVSNAADWLDQEGSDEEDDAALRQRYALQWKAVNGLTKYFYEALALRVNGVVSVAIHDQHPRGQGTVDIVVRGAAGLPTEKLLADVRQEVEANRPQNDHVLVKAPTPIMVNLTAALELSGGSADDIKAKVENRLRALFVEPLMLPGVPPVKIGEDLTLDRLVGVIMQVQGIKRVLWEQPTTDLHVPGDGLALLGALTLTTVWAPEA